MITPTVLSAAMRADAVSRNTKQRIHRSRFIIPHLPFQCQGGQNQFHRAVLRVVYFVVIIPVLVADLAAHVPGELHLDARAVDGVHRP